MYSFLFMDVLASPSQGQVYHLKTFQKSQGEITLKSCPTSGFCPHTGSLMSFCVHDSWCMWIFLKEKSSKKYESMVSNSSQCQLSYSNYNTTYSLQ